MKKLFVVLVSLPMVTFSQKCKYDRDDYDKFQKVRKIEKKVKAVKTFYHGNGYLNILLCKYGETKFFRLSTASANGINVGRNDAVVFLLDNDSTIKAYPDQIYFSDYNGYRSTFEGTYKFINASDFERLKTNQIKSIRLYHDNLYMDFDLKGNGQKDLLTAAKCF